jgi:hypothetical protein
VLTRLAVKQLSQEFAAVADPDTGKSHYAGKANNKASIGVNEIVFALESDRLSRQSNLAKNDKKQIIPDTSATPAVPATPNVPVKPDLTPSTVSQKKIQPITTDVSREIPTLNSYIPSTNTGASLAVLNKTTNVINGGTTYAVDDEKYLAQSPFIEKQYYG